MERDILEKIFVGLNETRVRYLVAGGLAVVAHGYVRFTADVDLFIHLERSNLINAMTVFRDLGYIPRAPVNIMDFTDDAIRDVWLLEKNVKVFSLWNPDAPATEVDVFMEPPLEFETAFSRAFMVAFGDDISVPVVGIDDLIDMKQAANRQKDIEDIRQLRKVKDSRET
jgi:predicted nucleotidyltransferase